MDRVVIDRFVKKTVGDIEYTILEENKDHIKDFTQKLLLKYEQKNCILIVSSENNKFLVKRNIDNSINVSKYDGFLGDVISLPIKSGVYKGLSWVLFNRKKFFQRIDMFDLFKPGFLKKGC